MLIFGREIKTKKKTDDGDARFRKNDIINNDYLNKTLEGMEYNLAITKLHFSQYKKSKKRNFLKKSTAVFTLRKLFAIN
mgnify:CR=1 FL=1